MNRSIFPYHTGYSVQSGRGIGSLFSGLFKALIPMGKTAVKIGKKFIKNPVVKNLVKEAKNTALQTGLHMATNILENKNVSEGVKNDINKGKQKMADTLKQVSKGAKRKQESAPKKKKKRRKKTNTGGKDIFS